jgi:hypothetical protein
MRRPITNVAPLLTSILATTIARVAGAQVPPPPSPVSATSTTEEVQPPRDPARSTDVEPKVAEAVAPGRVTFDIDPVADIGIIAVSLGFAGGMLTASGFF